jgi:hypothetical protein
MASYIERSLGDGEKIVARAHFPWVYTISAWARFLVPLTVLMVLVSFTQGRPAPFSTDDPLTWLIILTAVATLFGFYLFAMLLALRATTEIGVTSHRFVEKTGLFALRTNEIALHNIEGVRVNQSVAGRVFNYGTVRIEGTGVDAVTTPSIADPVAFVKAIQTAREQAPR